MIISHQHKFIFIKTRKTAGTSLEIALSQFCKSRDIVWSLAAEDTLVRKRLGIPPHLNTAAPLTTYKLEDWKKLFLQGKRKQLPFRRHSPAAVIKSYVGDEIWNQYYKFCFERNPFDRAISFYYWNTRGQTPSPDINKFLQSCSQKQLSNWRKYTINDEIAVDFIGRYERLEDDLAVIGNQIKLPNLILPATKNNTRASREHYSKVLTPETRTHIENLCAPEIDYLGYH